MRRMTLLLAALLIVSMTEAQTDKDSRIKEIREAYALAKKKIDRNGKNGHSPKDMRIVVNKDGDEEIDLYNMTTIDYYFDESTIDGVLTKKPYFIVDSWSNNGHTRYSEALINPTDQQVMFCYMRGETHAGFVVESRYYYDASGKCIEAKHNTSNTWTTGESEMEGTKDYLKIFNMINADGDFTSPDTDAPEKPVTPKAKRMQKIRADYAKAKERIAQNEKAELPNELTITIHDQGDDLPPRTSVIEFFFDERCYFISEKIHSMSFDAYTEYLFDPEGEDLTFSYTRSQEEGNTSECRYYFDENGECIEIKANYDETDDGFYDKQAAKEKLAIFHALMTE